jgi:succinate dehydrogenase hydrophobic anchor subunit
MEIESSSFEFWIQMVTIFFVVIMGVFALVMALSSFGK